MLKLSYTESGLHMERVSVTLEDLLAQRLILALRTGQSLYIEPGKAAFLLSTNMLDLVQLELALQMERSQSITVSPADAEFVEVSLAGTWIAATAEAHEGVFVTALADRTEFFVYKLWEAQLQVSSLT